MVGQRLARVPCSKCSEPVEADPKTLELLGLDPGQIDASGLRKGPGCGRAALEEVLRVTPPDPDLARRASQRPAPEAAEPPGQVAPPPKTPPKVLVLDDDHAIAEVAAATGFIPKPFSERQLRGEVAAVLQRRPALVDHPA